MSAHVLLNLCFGKEMKCVACQEFISFFCNKFSKLNINIGARVLDSIYHRTLNLLKYKINHIFGVKKLRSCHLLYNVVNGHHCIMLLNL